MRHRKQLDALVVAPGLKIFRHLSSRRVSLDDLRETSPRDPLLLHYVQFLLDGLALNDGIRFKAGVDVDDGQDLALDIVPFQMQGVHLDHLVEKKFLGQKHMFFQRFKFVRLACFTPVVDAFLDDGLVNF